MTNINVGVTLQSRAGKFIRDMKRSGASIGAFQKRIADRRPLKRAATAVRRHRGEFVKLKTAYDATGRSDVALRQQLGSTTRRLRNARAAAHRYGASLRRVDKQARGLRGSLAKLKGGKFGAIAGGVSAALVARQLYQIKKDETSALLRLGTVLPAGGDRRKQLNTSRNAAHDFAAANPGDANAVLAAEYTLRSAGIAGAREAAQTVTKLATVTGGAAEQVAETFSTAALNFDADNKRIGDLLAQTQFQYAIKNFGQLGEAFNESVKGAKKAEVPLADTLAALGAAHGAGLKGGRAGTAFNAFLRQLPDAAKEFGFDIARNGEKLDLFKTMQRFKTELDKISDIGEKQALLQKTLGDEGSAFIPLLDRLEEVIINQNRLVAESQNAVEDKHKEFRDHQFAEFENLGDSLVQLGSTIGDLVLPPLSLLATGLTGIVGAIDDALGWLYDRAGEQNNENQGIRVFDNGLKGVGAPQRTHPPAAKTSLKPFSQLLGGGGQTKITNNITVTGAGDGDNTIAKKIAYEIRRQTEASIIFKKPPPDSFLQNLLTEKV